VVVDRHSNFYLNEKKRISIKELVFRFLSFFSIRFADITIVTNKYLSHVVQVTGGRAFVLHDKIPDFIINKDMSISGNDFVFMISSFNRDEPIEEVWKAANLLTKNDIKIFVSGNPQKLLPENLFKNTPPNVTFTGFLPENEFVKMLNRASAIMVLTDAEYTLLCGCYEAVSVEKPLITSGTIVLKELFDRAIYVNSNPESIAEGVKKALQRPEYYIDQTKEMKKSLIVNWKHQFRGIDQAVCELTRKTN
jgi:glycosyltransferase involved in cell wall biosynthesis